MYLHWTQHIADENSECSSLVSSQKGPHIELSVMHKFYFLVKESVELYVLQVHKMSKWVKK
jgi:hypothetical protein